MNQKEKQSILTVSAVICCFLTGCGRTEINVNQYLTTEISGYDGNGSAAWHIDLGQLVKENLSAFGLKEGYSAAEYQTVLDKLHSNMKAEYDKVKGLSNGDAVKLTWENSIWTALESDFKVKFVTENVDVTVSGLQKVIEVNPFDKITVTFIGTAPNGYAEVDIAALDDLPEAVWYDAAPQEGLSNGDKVKVTISESTVSNLANKGYRLTETEKEYTVEGLDG